MAASTPHGLGQPTLTECIQGQRAQPRWLVFFLASPSFQAHVTASLPPALAHPSPHHPLAIPPPIMASRDVSRRQDQYKGKAQFKNDELRRRREEAQVEIRRQKRDESMAKRRNLNVAAQGAMTDGDSDEEEVNGGMLEKQVGRRRRQVHRGPYLTP